MKEKDIYKKVSDLIRTRKILEPQDKVLVALSGGADSVALLMVLQQLQYVCEAVHCNFHLRDEESDRDEQFVRDLCRQRNVRLHVKSFDTLEYARQKGISIEMAARELRYDYFEVLRKRGGFSAVAVAHHRDDNVETLFLNLIRGTGIKGLTGMQYRNGAVVRPLLEVSREDIEHFLMRQGQTYVTDRTNLEDEAVRNKIRLNILPLMREINPSVSDTLQNLIHRLNDVHELYRVAVDRIKEKVYRHHCIDLEMLRKEPAPQAILYEILADFGFHSALVDDIYEQSQGESGRVYESEHWRLLRDRDCLLLREKRDVYACTCAVLPLEGWVQVAPDVKFMISRRKVDAHFEIPRRKDTVCLDLDKIQYPLSVRLAEEGDRFVPFGMEGSKLISDYLTNAKKTVFEKERQLVVCSGELVAWLVNERADNRFRIDANTSHVLIIQASKS